MMVKQDTTHPMELFVFAVGKKEIKNQGENKMQSHYEINVSKNEQHFFATAPRSCISIAAARTVFKALAKRFKQSEGFQITVTHWEGTGSQVDTSIFDDEYTHEIPLPR